MAGGFKKLHGQGRAQVDVSADWFEPFDRIMREVMPRTQAVMGDATKEVFDNAKEKWPVKLLHGYERKALDDPDSTPHLKAWIKRKERQRRPKGIGNYSKGQLEYGWRVRKDAAEVFIRNLARNQGRPYTHYIRGVWPYENQRIANELIYKPMKKLAKELVRLMEEDLAAIANKKAA